MNRLNFNISNAENGYILRTKLVAEDGGSTGEPIQVWVFNSPEELTAWFNEKFPVLKNKDDEKVIVFIKDVPRDKKIANIKIIREFTGLSLKDSKDMVDRAEGTFGNRTQVWKDFGGDFTREEAVRFAKAIQLCGANIEIMAKED